MQVLFSCCSECPSSGSLIFGGQIVHINEGKGKLALFYTASNVLLTPPPPHFYCFPSSSFLLFSLLLLLIFIIFPPPPPPHFCFPPPPYNKKEEEEEEGKQKWGGGGGGRRGGKRGKKKKEDSLLSLTILIDFFQIADPTSTLHRPHIDPTSTPFRKKSLSQSSTDTRNGVLRTVKITEKWSLFWSKS